MCQHISPDYISFQIGQNLIYKDQCTKCFHTNQMDSGIHLCLKCFNGGCFGQSSFNHSLQHFQTFKQHSVVLTIKKTLKQDPAQNPQAITKVAIGVQGGAQFDKLWQTFTYVQCLSCQKTIPNQDYSPQLQALVDSILLSKSAYQSQSIGEWEAELKVCEHSKTLKTVEGVKKIQSKQLANCTDCNLSANLWLCLHCGYLGCGRKYYDGSGGNNHAVDHGKATGHSVVVKMGTITPEGKASVHCYTCDDEIIDQNLAEHLIAFGIDVMQQRKTQKTLAEIELQANLNLNLSKQIQHGRILIPRYGPGYTGLNNLGNSCYIASVLQILFTFPEFIQRYYTPALEHLNVKCRVLKPADCYLCQMHKLAHGLVSGKYSEKKLRPKIVVIDPNEPPKFGAGPQKPELQEYQDGVKPHMFKAIIGNDHQEFKTGKQQDALEYMNHLFEKIQKNEKKAKLNDVTKMFNFKLETRLQCQKCKGVRYSEAIANQITLVIPGVDQLIQNNIKVFPFNKCLENFFGEEVVEYQCPKCKVNSFFSKQDQNLIQLKNRTQRLKTLPRVLIFSVQRFSFANWVPKKVDIDLTGISQKDNLNFQGYKSTGLQPGEQQLPELQGAGQEQQKFDATLLSAVVMMGVPEHHAKHALLQTGQSSPQAAISWYFENLQNPKLNEPIPKVKKAKSSGSGANPDLVQSLVGMGFTQTQATAGLIKFNNNIDLALNQLFQDPDGLVMELNQAEEEKKDNDDGGMDLPVTGASLKGFITHLGASVGMGHYVAHIWKNNEWIYYNDDKVTTTDMPPLGKGYIYFFESIKE